MNISIIRKPPRFVRQTAAPADNFGIRRKSVLINGEWTAHPEYLRGSAKTVYAKQTFTLKNVPDEAYLLATVDDSAEIFLNGRRLGEITGFRIVNRFKAAPFLKQGENELRFKVENVVGPTGLVFELTGPGLTVGSGKETLFSFDGKDDWKPAHCFGRPPAAPWGKPGILQEHQ